jgi:hypothetical protein
MDVHCLVLLATSHFLSANVPAPDSSQVALNREPSLEGEWVAVSAAYDGKAGGTARVRFRSGSLELAMDRQAVGLHYQAAGGVVECQILGRRIPGIYRFDGNRLYLCLGRQGGERPRSFTSKPGSGHTLLILMRKRP